MSYTVSTQRPWPIRISMKYRKVRPNIMRILLTGISSTLKDVMDMASQINVVLPEFCGPLWHAV